MMTFYKENIISILEKNILTSTLTKPRNGKFERIEQIENFLNNLSIKQVRTCPRSILDFFYLNKDCYTIDEYKTIRNKLTEWKDVVWDVVDCLVTDMIIPNGNSKDICNRLAEEGYLTALQIIRNHGADWDDRVPYFAAIGRHYDVLKYALDNGCPVKEITLIEAVKKCHLQMIQFLQLKNVFWKDYRKDAFTLACDGPEEFIDIYLIQYLIDCKCKMTAKGMALLAEKNKKDIIVYLYEIGCPYDDEACFRASSKGNVELLYYLIERNFPFNESAVWAACRYGHLDCLDYLIKTGCPMNNGLTQLCILFGHFHCLKLIVEYGFPLDENCFAPERFFYWNDLNISILEYLVQKNCPLNQNLLIEMSIYFNDNCQKIICILQK